MLRRKSFDYILDLQHSRISQLLSFLSFPLVSAGYARRWGWILSRKARYNRSDDPLMSQEKILKLIGVNISDKTPAIWDIKPDNQFNFPHDNLIGINVSASARWESKNWPPKYIGELVEMLNKTYPSYRVIFLGDQFSKSITQKIESCMGQQNYNLCGKTTLRDLPSIMQRLKVFITPDTAALHLSLAVRIPTVALFGPTNPLYHTNADANLHVLCRKVSCSFCYKPRCVNKEKNICMRNITPHEVFTRVKDIIQRSEPVTGITQLK